MKALALLLVFVPFSLLADIGEDGNLTPGAMVANPEAFTGHGVEAKVKSLLESKGASCELNTDPKYSIAKGSNVAGSREFFCDKRSSWVQLVFGVVGEHSYVESVSLYRGTKKSRFAPAEQILAMIPALDAVVRKELLLKCEPKPSKKNELYVEFACESGAFGSPKTKVSYRVPATNEKAVHYAAGFSIQPRFQ